MIYIEAAPKQEVKPQDPLQYKMVFLDGLYGPKNEQGIPTPGKKLAIFVNKEATRVVFLEQTFPADFDTLNFEPDALKLRTLQIIPQIHEINPQAVIAISEPKKPLPIVPVKEILRGIRNELRQSEDYRDYPMSFKISTYRTFRRELTSMQLPELHKHQQ